VMRQTFPTVVALFVALLLLASSSSAASENVILVTIDGLRWQEVFHGAEKRLINRADGGVRVPKDTMRRFWTESDKERRRRLMPFFWNVIAKKGQVFGDPSAKCNARCTNGLYFSYPGYNEILTGRSDPRIISNAKLNNPNVTVLEWLHRKAKYRGRVGAFGSWDVFPYILNQKRSGMYVNAGWRKLDFFRNSKEKDAFNATLMSLPRYWENVRYDVFTFRGAYEYLHVKKPRVIYVALGETDDWAHSSRYDLYLDAAQRNDQYIQRLWSAVQKLPGYAGKTSLVITTDHGRGSGRTAWKSHGTPYLGSDRTWIAVLGPDTPALGIRRNVNVTQSQVAATVAHLLGEKYQPKHKVAGPLPGVKK